MGSTWIQVLGVLLVAAGLAVVWSPWALVMVGCAMWAVPEIGALIGVARTEVRRRAEAQRRAGGQG